MGSCVGGGGGGDVDGVRFVRRRAGARGWAGELMPTPVLDGGGVSRWRLEGLSTRAVLVGVVFAEGPVLEVSHGSVRVIAEGVRRSVFEDHG